MDIFNYPNTLQEKTNKFFQCFDLINSYIDDLLVLKIIDWTIYFGNTEPVIIKLKEN